MIASLPMYDRPSNAAAHDALWSLIRDGLSRRGIAAPIQLDRSVAYRESWARPDLVLGQICVLPYQRDFKDRLTLIGAGDFAVNGCDPGYFCSYFVCQKDDPRQALSDFQDARFAANALHSYSGYASAAAFAAQEGITLRDPIITGSHDASVRLLVDGGADLASVDAHTWSQQCKDMDAPSNLRVLCQTRQAPGQSFVTRKGEDPAPFFDAIKDAIKALSNSDREAVGLQEILRLPSEAYKDALP